MLTAFIEAEGFKMSNCSPLVVGGRGVATDALDHLGEAAVLLKPSVIEAKLTVVELTYIETPIPAQLEMMSGEYASEPTFMT